MRIYIVKVVIDGNFQWKYECFMRMVWFQKQASYDAKEYDWFAGWWKEPK